MSADGTFDPRAELDRLRSEFPRVERERSERDSGLVTESTSRTALLDTRSLRFKRMRYNVIASSNMLNVDATRGGFRVDPVFETLTYRDASLPEPNHIARHLDARKKWALRRGFKLRYVWVAELQMRGVLHYHVIYWLPHKVKLPMADKWRRVVRNMIGPGDQGPQQHACLWPHGWTNIKRATCAVGYLAHYAGKLKSKGVSGGFAMPKGFRLFGKGGLDVTDRMRMAWANLPGWLRDRVQPEHRVKRILGGGWIARETLDFYPSIWKIGRVVKVGGGAFLSLLPALPEGVELCSPW